MTRQDKILVTILGFNALTAIVGGIGLIFGSISPPTSWLEHSFFNTYTIPGLILLLIVGSSAAFAAYSFAANKYYRREVADISGLIMLTWITGEIISIVHFSWLQAIYLVTGFLTLALADPDYKKSFSHLLSVRRRRA